MIRTRSPREFLLAMTAAGLAVLGGVATADATAPELAAQRDAAVAAAVRAVAPSLVRLRAIGANGGDAIGAAGATVTGCRVGDGWVLASDYGLPASDDTPLTIVCQSPGGPVEAAQLVARDRSRRLVLLRLGDRASDAPESLPGRPIRVGQTAIVVGLGHGGETPHATVGVVSAVGRLGGRALQIDAATSPTNYGGWVVGLDGSPLGVVAPLASQAPSAVELYDSGIGFAVSVADLNERLPILAAGRSLEPGRLGVTLGGSTPLESHAELAHVAEGGPAAAAGLRSGDTITRVGSEPTPTAWSFRAVAGGLDAEVPVTIEYTRDDQPRQTVVAPERRRDVQPPAGDAGSDLRIVPPQPSDQ